VLVVAAVACAYGTYYLYSNVTQEAENTLPGGGLHRSNAIHRRRRRNTANLEEGRGNPTADLPIFIDDVAEDENGNTLVARTLTDGETVVDDQAFQEEYGWTQMPQSYQRNGQNIVQLLFRVSEDATRRNAYVHRGCACNSCNVVPIRGIRYRCANCADYDLCESCESQGVHTKTHIFYKIRVPAPSFGPRHIQPVTYTGDPDSSMPILPKEIITKLSRETGFERPELDAYWEQWTFMANTDWRDDPDEINLAMDRSTFERCLVPSAGRHTPPSLIFDRMFAFYDTNKDDLIGFPEFLHGIAYRKKKDKWLKIFEGYDIDGDGYVDRKDFLRIFRSYYVLYRQMHKDMQEGMEEQQMGSTNVQRLVSGRQPLSSAFGLGDYLPRTPDLRIGEGKTIRPNGDLQVIDGRGVVTESGNDTGNREDVFRRDGPHFVASNRRSRQWIRNSTGYWDTMLNPPETIEQMPDIRTLNRIRGQVEEILNEGGQNSNAHPALLVPRDTEDDEGSSSDDSDGYISAAEDDGWLPNFVTLTDEDAAAIDGPGTSLADLRPSSRRAAISHAVHRENAQREVYERWKRRQFYTDEEEGATPPADWKEDDDVLAHIGIAGESSKSQSRPSIHSRSSSRVRFAEDTDDFDTRSNPSTSSRSVPERWGGMEIPDAEKDAGKEILYQVTQQAFNELLDPFFKEMEDYALEAAARKPECERYRSQYTTSEFEKWAQEKETEDERKRKEEIRPRDTMPTPLWPTIPEVEHEDVRERPIEDLLAATGYSVETTHQDPDVSVALAPAQLRDAGEEQQNESSSISHEPPLHPPTSPSQTEVLSIIAQYDNDRDPSTSSTHSTPPGATATTSSSDSSSYRDPTMPQFRPNSTPLPCSPSKQEPQLPPAQVPPPPTKHTVESKQTLLATLQEETTPTKDKLYKLWKCDQASKEAEKRGGWGRMNFEEFEKKVKTFLKEGKINQMDYLGSWIDFCIP
jgi:Ca2+-binding EF-hand superfamily protein